ncbi:MAG: hypothetical protein F4X64_04235 [Chloroflexi bacterium]|nr:hypothetical protein [Chloroflexota bacterium]
MPIVQNNINRVNRMIENILDQPIVIRVMSPVQPIANTLTTRYLDYAIPREDQAVTSRPVSYTVVDSHGDVSWEGDTGLLAEQPERRRKSAQTSPAPRKPIAYSVIDSRGNIAWEGDTDLLPLHLQRRYRNR